MFFVANIIFSTKSKCIASFNLWRSISSPYTLKKTCPCCLGCVIQFRITWKSWCRIAVLKWSSTPFLDSTNAPGEGCGQTWVHGWRCPEYLVKNGEKKPKSRKQTDKESQWCHPPAIWGRWPCVGLCIYMYLYFPACNLGSPQKKNKKTHKIIEES